MAGGRTAGTYHCAANTITLDGNFLVYCYGLVIGKRMSTGHNGDDVVVTRRVNRLLDRAVVLAVNLSRRGPVASTYAGHIIVAGQIGIAVSRIGFPLLYGLIIAIVITTAKHLNRIHNVAASGYIVGANRVASALAHVSAAPDVLKHKVLYVQRAVLGTRIDANGKQKINDFAVHEIEF